jgi:hypothetical protein
VSDSDLLDELRRLRDQYLPFVERYKQLDADMKALAVEQQRVEDEADAIYKEAERLAFSWIARGEDPPSEADPENWYARSVTRPFALTEEDVAFLEQLAGDLEDLKARWLPLSAQSEELQAKMDEIGEEMQSIDDQRDGYSTAAWAIVDENPDLDIPYDLHPDNWDD